MASKFYPLSKSLVLLTCSCLLSLFSFSQNQIVIENTQTGSPISEWGVPDFRDNRIAGFSTKMSLNKGETASFKISSEAGASFTLKIYRLGYYGGNGARLVADLGTIPGTAQPAGNFDPVTGLLDCDNWSVALTWNIPTTAVSGFYIAKMERTGGGSNHVAFVVRDDASNADLYLQVPDATWQAYNGYGGNSLYDGTTAFPSGHAVKVSYNRPFFPYNTMFNSEAKEADWYMNAVYPMIRWLERNGYDMSYAASNDIATKPSLLLNHKVFVSVGHDEYWSKEQRENVEMALNAGIHLAFFTGNEVYWKTRWENQSDGEHRTLVCYKEGLMGDGSVGERVCGTKCDASSTEWTGLWRTGADYDAGRPENALVGQISWTETDAAIQVPSKYKNLRFWRNTGVAGLADGQVATLAPNTLGFEWDYEQYNEFYPEARITMSSTMVGNLNHKLSLYRHSSGAWVFGAGTVQWSWGLDGEHLGGPNVVSSDMQQATVNLFADMGVQPATLQGGLTPATMSTDASAPSSVIIFPTNGSSIPASAPVTITGTATDAGGVVAGVEVSTDGGATWKQAELDKLDIGVNWSFTWTPSAEGTATIKTRAFDDSGNKEIPGPGTTITIGPAVCPCTIFTSTNVPAKPWNNDGQGGIELGVKFQASQDGFITAIRFYKGEGASGTNTGSLWTSTGTLLGRVVFTNETTSGWQQMELSTPVAITAGVTYLVSYHNSNGDYAATNPFFTEATINGPLRALASGEEGPNGVYAYTASPTFPTNASQTNNYWVDVVYTRENGNAAPVLITQPVDQAVCVGDTVMFRSTANGQPVPTVQWQSSTDSMNWTNIGGATDSILSFIADVDDHHKQYRAVWSNEEGQAESEVATLSVNALPALSGPLQVSTNSAVVFSYTPTSTVAGTVFTWTRAAVAGISNPASSGPGGISEQLINTTSAPIDVVYVYTLDANGCTQTQSLVVTVNPASDCGVNSSITSKFNHHTIPAGRFIWFNSSLKLKKLDKKKDRSPAVIHVSNSWINFKANGRDYKLRVPDSYIRFDKDVQTASAAFVNNRWEIVVPIGYDKDVFMGGLAYKVPRNLPGHIKNVKWTSDISLSKGVEISWRWAAATYTQLGTHDKLDVKPSDDKKGGPHHHGNHVGTPENFISYLVPGASSNGKKDFVGKYSPRKKIHCKNKNDHSQHDDHDDGDDGDDDDDDGKPITRLIRKIRSLVPLAALNQGNHKLEINVSPNPSNNHFNLTISSKAGGPSTVIVTDILGIVRERYEKVNANTTLQVGAQLRAGVYFIAVLQGNQRRTVMVVKAL